MRTFSSTFIVTNMIALVLCTTHCGTDHGTSQLAAEKGSQSKEICDSNKIPKSLVIVRNFHDIHCGNGSILKSNAYRIIKPGKRQEVCKNSPVPDGYVVTEYGQLMDCGMTDVIRKNSKTIEKL